MGAEADAAPCPPRVPVASSVTGGKDLPTGLSPAYSSASHQRGRERHTPKRQEKLKSWSPEGETRDGPERVHGEPGSEETREGTESTED